MGLFSSRSKDDYERAAKAVQSGHPTREQWEMNEKASRQAGSMGKRARLAREGKLKI